MARTTIDIDNRLIQEGLKLTRLSTKKELVNYALAELIRHAKKEYAEIRGQGSVGRKFK